MPQDMQTDHGLAATDGAFSRGIRGKITTYTLTSEWAHSIHANKRTNSKWYWELVSFFDSSFLVLFGCWVSRTNSNAREAITSTLVFPPRRFIAPKKRNIHYTGM